MPPIVSQAMTRREAGISASSRSRSRVMDKHREGTRFGGHGAIQPPRNCIVRTSRQDVLVVGVLQ